MKVSVLTENTVYKRGFLGEHGLSLLIETEKEKYLFDTGQSGVFLHNAEKLKIDLERLNGIILSHGHYDHCGGIEYWSKKLKTCKELEKIAPIFISEKAFDEKYTKHLSNNKLRYIGIEDKEGIWKDLQACVKFIYTKEGRTIVSNNVFLLSKIPYVTEFEPMPDGFWKKIFKEQTSELTVDTLEDEQLLVIRSKEGLCVFAGCAHPGIINCLRYVQKCFPGEHIHSLVAGMHLKGCSTKRLQATIQALKEIDPDIIVPLHCTGITAIAAIKEVMKDSCILAEVGKIINL